jgi:hypothetical protein
MPLAQLTAAELCSMANQRIADGLLPAVLWKWANVGYGSGAYCRLCRHEIDRYQVEYEITGPHIAGSMPLHVSCHAIWRECVKRLLVG